MTKLNYATRRASGAKMGTIASKDIQKRSLAMIKGGGSAAAKDPGLELILCGKQLGDEGLQILCKALIETTATGGVKIEELNLSDNELELSSLRHLGEVIAISPWLRDLDLSKNRIQVETERDVEEWTNFLRLFRSCFSMRLLDFSGNPMGDRAYEVFLRVYASEDPVAIPRQELWHRVLDFETSNSADTQPDEALIVSRLKEFKFEGSSTVSLPKANTNGRHSISSPNTLSPPSHHQPSTAGSPGVGVAIVSGGSSCPESPISPPSLHGVQLRGLRSIPYLVFSNAGVTDAAALWLSYIVERHPFPSDLMPHLPLIKDGPQVAVFKALEEFPNCKGVIWVNNNAMTTFGSDLLHLAEKYRVLDSADIDSDADDSFHEISMVRSTSQESESPAPPTTPFKTRPGRSLTVTKSPATARTRKGSGNFEHAQKDGPSELRELEKARFKTESVVLRDPKTKRPELWQTVLRMLIVSRAIMFGYDDSMELDPFSDEESIVDEENIVTPEMCQPTLDTISKGVFRLVPPKVDTSSMPAATGLYSDVVRRHSGGITAYQEENMQSPSHYSKRTLQSHHMSSSPMGGISIASPPNGFTKTYPAPGFDIASRLTLEDSSPAQRRRSSQSVHPFKAKTPATDPKPSPSSQLPGNLPFHIWSRIISFAEDPRNLTSPTQRDNIFNYAQSKETLAKESEYIGKTVGVQIRKVLDQVQGLAYEI